MNAPVITAATAASFADLVTQIAAHNPDPDALVCVDFLHDQLHKIIDELERKKGKPQREAECRERGAYHEAAHVVASWAMGFRSIGSVFINDAGDGIAYGLGRDLEGTPRHVIARHVVINMAGDAGEIVRFGSSGYCDRHDLDAARNTIEGRHPAFINRRERDGDTVTTRRISRYEQRLKRVAERTLRAHWPAVEALAGLLLQHGTLNHRDVRACIRAYFRKRRRAGLRQAGA